MTLKNCFKRPSLGLFVLLITVLTVLGFNWPVARYMSQSLNLGSKDGLVALAAVGAVLLLLTSLVLHLLFLISTRLGRAVAVLLTLANALALFFMVTYQVVLDKTMIGNILNTQTSEAGQFLSFKLLLYVLIFGVLPSWWIIRTPLAERSRWRLMAQMLVLLVSCVAVIWSASSSWLWIDKHAKILGGTILPWSYLVNSGRYYQEYQKQHAEQVLLPDAEYLNHRKSVVVLVIGESARADNFSLYGYARDTNPHMQNSDVVALQNAKSCASYTTAAVACILSPVPESEMSENYEPLPSYLQRQGVTVIWRTKNWGEPPIKVSSYLKSADLAAQCQGEDCQYDGVLLSGLGEQIQAAATDKVFVVLHQTGSHGPTYFKKYPQTFEYFSPVCDSVELSKCTHEALINAYDNTIRYNDDFLSRLKTELESFQGAETSFIYLSDHGESLGESGLYLHGTPYSLAPAYQLNIPFMVWGSQQFIDQHQLDMNKLRTRKSDNGQELVFHTVMGALGLTSPIYQPQLDLFAQARK